MNITVEEYFNNDNMRIDIFKSKYLKSPEQTVDNCFNNISIAISEVSIENNSEYWKNKWKNDLLKGIWRPGGSIIASINNNTKKISTFNCTTVKIKDDTLESIYKARYECAKMAAYRQGLGIEFSKLRPKGSPVNNSSEISEGVINWMKSFDSIAEEVGQRGRRPAILSALKDNHPDIIEFIKAKSDLSTLKNMNISVQISDDFMKAVKNDDDWELFFELENERISKIVKATYIFDLLCKQSFKHAEPGLQFIDRMKDGSIQEALGYEIVGTNACSEKPLPDYGVCALASLNMENVPFINDENFHSFMQEHIYSLVRFMDNVVQYEIDNDYKSPLKEQLKIVKDLREIGLGVTNLHKWFYDNNIEYGSNESINVINEFFKYYQYYAFKSSCELALERGACDAWNLKNNANNFKETKFLQNLFITFNDLKEMFYETGIRNGALLSIAPTGSISMTFPNDCLSSGIEPTIGYAYWRKTRAVSRNDYDYYFVLPSSVKQIVLEKIKQDEKYDINDYELIANFTGSELDHDGVIGKKIINVVNKYIDTDLLKSAHEIDPFKKIELMSKVQQWVDAAIAVTYNLPEDYKVENLPTLYTEAFNNNLKALSIYREGSREGILIFDDPVTHKKKYNNKNIISCNDKQYRPDNIIYHCAPKRPKKLPCKIHHCSVAGEKWIVLIGILNESPYEIFAGKKNEFFNISANVRDGEIIKNGQNYTLKIPYRNSYIEYNEITELFMNEEYKSLTRMISLSLRHGVYHEFIIKQLKKSSDFVSDFVAVVSRVLSKYIKDFIYDNNDNLCPNCGEILLNESGCMKCIDCGYSKCE
jgi:ribonucleoside-diphosphate reductase alpha chain